MRSRRQVRDFNLTPVEGIIAVKHASNAGYAKAVCDDLPTRTLRAMAKQLKVTDTSGDRVVLTNKIIIAVEHDR